eukprot:scaffold694_cov338-Pavlova_lutheri.AAC.29
MDRHTRFVERRVIGANQAQSHQSPRTNATHQHTGWRLWFVSHSSCRKAEAYTCVPIEGGDGPYDGPHQSPNRVAKLAPDPVVIRRLLLSRVVFERARRTTKPTTLRRHGDDARALDAIALASHLFHCGATRRCRNSSGGGEAAQ